MKHKKADHREGDPFFVEHRRFERQDNSKNVWLSHFKVAFKSSPQHESSAEVFIIKKHYFVSFNN